MSLFHLRGTQGCRYGKQAETEERIVMNSHQRTDKFIRFYVFVVMTMKTAIFWDIIPYGFCKNRCFG
jgi:hypothetical protein